MSFRRCGRQYTPERESSRENKKIAFLEPMEPPPVVPEQPEAPKPAVEENRNNKLPFEDEEDDFISRRVCNIFSF